MFNRLLSFPLCGFYYAASRIHAGWMTRGRKFPPLKPPLVVVGALKSGGSGKTSMTAALARICRKKGLRVAIICYWLRGYDRDCPLKKAGKDWRHSSDEAVLLARLTGDSVFVTRNRRQAWKRLAETGKFDVLISDDGFQDPRLTGAFNMVLTGENEKPGFTDLLPCGPFRQTASSLNRATLVLTGPVLLKNNSLPERSNCFYRRLLFPETFRLDNHYTVLCALGDNGLFIRDLESCGVKIGAVFTKKDHESFTLEDIGRAKSTCSGYGLITTEKDYLKMPSSNLPLSVIKQEILLSNALENQIFQGLSLPFR